ncbi:MAG: hypothetical protein ACRD1R_11550, partial [Acidobacteriota bacterium]
MRRADARNLPLEVRMRSSRAIADLLRSLPVECRTLARTRSDLEILCVRTGGTKPPPVFIKAGSHANEIAGIYAALELVSRLKSEHPVYIVPCANPFSFDGYAAALSDASGVPVAPPHREEISRMLERYGDPVYEQDDFGLFLVGDIGFVSVDPSTDLGWELERRGLERLLKERAELRSKLAGKWILIPECEACVRDWSPYETGARTSVVDAQGWAGNPNRFYDRDDAPVEVACIRELLEEIRPAMALDLHESLGLPHDYFVVLPPA